MYGYKSIHPPLIETFDESPYWPDLDRPDLILRFFYSAYPADFYFPDHRELWFRGIFAIETGKTDCCFFLKPDSRTGWLGDNEAKDYKAWLSSKSAAVYQIICWKFKDWVSSKKSGDNLKGRPWKFFLSFPVTLHIFALHELRKRVKLRDFRIKRVRITIWVPTKHWAESVELGMGRWCLKCLSQSITYILPRREKKQLKKRSSEIRNWLIVNSQSGKRYRPTFPSAVISATHRFVSNEGESCLVFCPMSFYY